MTMINNNNNIIINRHLYEFYYGHLYYGAGIVKGWTVGGSNPGRGRFSAPV